MTKKLTLRFASLNLLNYLAPPNAFYEFMNIYSEEEWHQKNQWIAKTIAEQSPDIVAFQEVFSPDELECLMQELGYPYFAAQVEPHIVDDHLYSQPGVAIASRYPISDHTAVEMPQDVLRQVGLQGNYEYSRKPLLSSIDVPRLGIIDVYSVHFKSQRATLSVELSRQEETEFDGLGIAKWASTMLRGLEAQCLRHFVNDKNADMSRVSVIMGDFNQSLDRDELKALTQTGDSVTLYDAWQLQQRLPESRTATHYYFDKANVLDYVLLSDHFDPNSANCIGTVDQYHVSDRHLIDPKFPQDNQASDHALVIVEVVVD